MLPILSARNSEILVRRTFDREICKATGVLRDFKLAVLMAIPPPQHGFFRFWPSVDWDSIRNRAGAAAFGPPPRPDTRLRSDFLLMSMHRRTAAQGEVRHRGRAPSWIWLTGIVLAAAGLSATATRSQAANDDDDAIPVRLPELIANYSHPATGVEFTRYEAVPAFQLSAHESPDPRLPTGGWRVTYRGVIEILRPGKYDFDVAASGKVTLAIAGKQVELSRRQRCAERRWCDERRRPGSGIEQL